MEHVQFLQEVTVNRGLIEAFPNGFPHAIHQAFGMPLAWQEKLREDSMRYVYTLVAAKGELTAGKPKQCGWRASSYTNHRGGA